MKVQLQKRSERGIALVITLVMLAIVTTMAIVFLGVSRRERASVKVLEDIATANMMADSALERAKAEAIAKMAAGGSKLSYDLFNSRSFINPNGFDTSQSASSLPNPQNVGYSDKSGNNLNEASLLRMLANLQYDPRAPVFVETNANGAKEFRYYLDFDRNRLFETNGVVPVLDANGRPTGAAADVVGDPEWIGILERPDYPHSETNRFIGRMAYLVLPAGKTLDLNFIHNQGNLTAPDRIDLATAANGYTRNQGVGSWEINLAAFFRELNPTNGWPRATYNYQPGVGQLPTGQAFDNARSLLSLRYNARRFLASANTNLSSNPENPGNQNLFDRDEIDNYGDGPFTLPGQPIFRKKLAFTDRENDAPKDRPWPGSFNTNAFTDLQQIFSAPSADFTNRLEAPLRRLSTDDRYQFYKMAAQLGVDSTPAVSGKMHLNFDNAVGKITNTFKPWAYTTNSPLRFFTNAADLMLKASIDGIITISNRSQALFWGRQLGTYYLIGDTLVSTNFSVNNIQVYSPLGTNYPGFRQNEYSPAIHRILQVAVNIYDNMTNRYAGGAPTGPYLPTVFRPIYQKTATNLFISGWMEVTSAAQVGNGWTMNLAQMFTNNTVAKNVGLTNDNFYGEHLVIGAKKGHPNFNELALQTTTEISRKLEVVKASAGGKPSATNQMFLFSMEQRWGMEAWNSYSNRYPRAIALLGEVDSTIAIKDGTNLLTRPLQVWRRGRRDVTTLAANAWKGFTNVNSTNFLVLMNTNFVLLADAAYTTNGGFLSTNIARFAPIQPTPRFVIQTTNNVRFLVVDSATSRVLDFVSFDNLTTTMDVGSQLYAPPTASTSQFGGGKPGDNEDIYWDPTPVGGAPYLTRGVTNQLAAAAGVIDVSTAVWKAFRHSSPVQKDDDKNGAISVWRRFMGLPILATSKPVGPVTELALQSPFVPSRRVEQLISWQVNDPFVHYMAQDIAPVPGTDAPRKRPILDPPGPGPWNIGLLNTPAYRPWGGSPLQQAGGPTGDATAYSVGVKDAGVRRSDDWAFPIDDVPGANRFHFFANVGELGRIHRGTPWQTLYLKSIYTIQNTTNGLAAVPLPGTHPTDWKKWAGSAGTHPMHDWRLLDVFTTAANENATRGLLSVNQTNRAAWSAVLSGVIIPTNIVNNTVARSYGPHEGADPAAAYHAAYIDPATPQVKTIVDSINYARGHQLQIIVNPNIAANPQVPWDFAISRNPITTRTNNVFQHLGDVLGAPHLTVQSPFLNTTGDQAKSVLTDRALEYLPEQIMSLLQRDEPRFVVYAFGQSLKPAAGSLTGNPNFYHMCTNYQITGEVTTKTIFRVEGDLPIPGNPLTQNNSLRAVVESYEILPPVE